MAYTQNLKSAAQRHLRAAQMLHEAREGGSQPGCMAVAGYLFGLAGELAMKEIMRKSGMSPSNPRQDDPFFAHFPTLKTLLIKSVHGRRDGELRKLAENPQLFANWDTDMRYAPTDDVQDEWVSAWKESAEDLVGRMNLP